MTIESLARTPYAPKKMGNPPDGDFLFAEHTLIAKAIPVNTAKTVTTAYTVSVLDDLIECDATSAGFTVTLPDPTRIAFLKVTIKKIDSSAHAVTIGGTVDGGVNPTLTSQYASLSLMSDGAAWVKTVVTSATSAGLSGTVVHRSSDVTNNTNALASMGLLVPVSSGDSWCLRYILHVQNDSSPSGAVQFSLVFPAVTSLKAGLTAPTNSASTITAQGFNSNGSPLAISPWLNFATGAAGDIITIDCLFRHFTASGNVDMQFASSSGAGNTVTISDGSSVVGFQL